ncbi:pilus assembly protein PilX [Acinetobacter qingfengensis]|uniref:Pilus assembly protein PilX n=1 Tax=Acinetobacter qingfengensis TaxID=1262585 RepID=A0A1E7QXM9_9GAMM|nr:pilus assembly protein PilX [Acinetobacter qingfengensis]
MKHQNGSTLIVVLILLLMITIMGTLAVRQGLTTLNIATNTQANQLLFQSSDTPLYRLGSGGFSSTSGKATSLLGYALLNQGKEVIFCFRSQTSESLFNTSNTSLLTWNSAQTDITVSGTGGFCSLSTATDFASSRKAQMTQVAIIANPITSTVDTTPFSSTSLGTDSDSSNVTDTKLFRVYVNSFIPALSTATDAEITACLKRPNESPLSGSASTMSSCLKGLNIPFNSQVQDFKLDSCTISSANASTITSCS